MVDQPSVDVQNLAGEDLTFSATVYVSPEVSWASIRASPPRSSPWILPGRRQRRPERAGTVARL